MGQHEVFGELSAARRKGPAAAAGLEFGHCDSRAGAGPHDRRLDGRGTARMVSLRRPPRAPVLPVRSDGSALGRGQTSATQFTGFE